HPASGRCLGVTGSSTAAGAGAAIRGCETAADRQWTSWAGGEVRVFGDKCLDAYDQGTADGTRVITWTCNGQDNQKWTTSSDGTLRNVHAGRCLDTDRSGTAEGTALVLWSCDGRASQRWTRS
ncbi:ricin-type beta-trefoil lectin domain protein, partial [Streptomyces acidiscabies]